MGHVASESDLQEQFPVCQHYKDLLTQTADSTFCISGSVKFNLKGIQDPNLKTSVDLIGSFKQMKDIMPIRPESIEDLKKRIADFLPWMEKLFPHLDNKVNVHMAEVTACYNATCAPFLDPNSEAYHINRGFIATYLVLDEHLEGLPLKHLSPLQMSKLITYICSIWSEDEISLEQLELPGLDETMMCFFAAFRDLYQRRMILCPASKELDYLMRLDVARYLYSTLVFRDGTTSGKYLNDVFKIYRRHDVFGMLMTTGTVLVIGVRLPEGITSCFLFERTLEIFGNVVHMVNDVLGIRKELCEDKFQGLGLAEMNDGSISVQEAVDRVCAMINREIDEMPFCINAIMEKYENEENLLAFFKALLIVMNGHNHLYFVTKRYLNNKGESVDSEIVIDLND